MEGAGYETAVKIKPAMIALRWKGFWITKKKKMFQLSCGLNVCISMNPAHFLHPSPVRSPLGASIGARHCTSTQRRRKTSGAVAVLQTYIQIYIYYINYIIYIPTLWVCNMPRITNSSSRHVHRQYCCWKVLHGAAGCHSLWVLPTAPGHCKPQTAKENDFMTYCGFYHKTIMRSGDFLF